MREFETEMRVREIEQTINEATPPAQLALRAHAPPCCGRRALRQNAEPPLLCTAAQRPMDCGVCGCALAWAQVWASIVKNGCMILQNRGFAKETLTKEITDKCG